MQVSAESLQPDRKRLIVEGQSIIVVGLYRLGIVVTIVLNLPIVQYLKDISILSIGR